MAALLLITPIVRACLAEFRSMEFQVAHSPLIFVGRVEAVQNVPAPAQGPGSLKRLPGEGTPQIATVRVLRFIKGSAGRVAIRVHSGPVRSCAPYVVHYEFRRGQTRIFILSARIADDEGVLQYGGSLVEESALSEVTASLARVRGFRQEYLERLRLDQPDVLTTGTRFHREIAKLSETWPYLPQSPSGPGSEDAAAKLDREFDAAAYRVQDRLATVSVPTVLAALALDWCSDAPSYWADSMIWERA
jgi:hypothetical protein